MKHIIRFMLAFIYAAIKGCVVSFDYSEFNFTEPDWMSWDVIPGKTNCKVSLKGITLHGWKFCAWKHCSGFSVCPYDYDENGFLHVHVAIETF